MNLSLPLPAFTRVRRHLFRAPLSPAFAVASLALLPLAAATLTAQDTAARHGPAKLPTKEEMIASLDGKAGEGLRAAVAGLRPRITVHLHFQYDSTELASPDQRKWLTQVAPEVFNSKTIRPYLFVIEGHTDTRGSSAYNLALSQSRAEAIRNALIASGVDPGRIRAQGKGDLEPVSNGDTEDHHQQNRRVVFIREGLADSRQ